MADPILPNNPKAEEIAKGENELSFKLNEPVTTALDVNPFTNVDEEDSLSFVVLGRDSVEAQASLLASYTDLQQKSMSIDYNSMVSSMTVTEMPHKLTEVLQENVKLKETLRQNNESMKGQFNTLTMWQNEVMNLHRCHEYQFAKTKALINYLKNENAEIKAKLWLLQHFKGINKIISASTECGIINASIKQLDIPKQEIPEFIDAISKIAIESCKKYITSVMSKKFDEKLLQKLQQLETEEELESAMMDHGINYELYDDVETTESSKCEACSAKDEEIIFFKELIAGFERKMQCIFTPVKQDLLKTSNLHHQYFVQSIMQYNDMLHELTICFVKQIDRFATIEKSLKKIPELLDNSQKQDFKKELCLYCEELADEQIKIITDRQTLIKSQNQFQKIFSDYNSVLSELQVMREENAKSNILKDNDACENLQTSEQLECEKQLLEQEKKVFDQEKDELENEKKSFENQKKSLDMERISLQDERKLLEQEKISLNQEKMSLDHQSQLYEDCEKDLHNEKKILQARNEQLLSETSSLRQQIEEKDAQFKKTIEQLAQSTEEIHLLRSQLSLYEEDFQQEKRLKEALLEEKNKLDTELLKQIEFNQQLQDSNNGSVKLGQMFDDPNALCHRCPKCSKIFRTSEGLMRHVQICVDS